MGKYLFLQYDSNNIYGCNYHENGRKKKRPRINSVTKRDESGSDSASPVLNAKTEITGKKKRWGRTGRDDGTDEKTKKKREQHSVMQNRI